MIGKRREGQNRRKVKIHLLGTKKKRGEALGRGAERGREGRARGGGSNKKKRWAGKGGTHQKCRWLIIIEDLSLTRNETSWACTTIEHITFRVIVDHRKKGAR